MYILTGKYQGAFCCSPYSVEGLLNFMFSFKHEISVQETRTDGIKHWRNFAGCHNFYNVWNGDTRLQIILYKLEIFFFLS